MGDQEDKQSGKHAISRAIDVLRAIAKDGAGGARLVDLAASTGLPHPTVRRILLILIKERMVVQSVTTNRYRLGPLSFELGLAAGDKGGLVASCRPHMLRLAAMTKGTVYLMSRSGFDAICLDRVDGDYPIRKVLLRIGGRRPLGAGPAGLALLAAMDDAAIEEGLRTKGATRSLLAADSSLLRSAIEETRRCGFAITPDWALPGVRGVGMVVPSSNGQSAVSISAPTDQLNPEQLIEATQMLSDEIGRMQIHPHLRPKSR
ncbi:IclR family transcriptional regulator [Hydrogenophaga sp. BPS33]|uniref:IclR family transcriptional regulator n=1 Tax=Hydrogenophaga sp. BPS33 TaxID=2651974 RepID=UPI00135BD90E|nr:IclR family transcriptional regulator [Hydrogenophaga sp. BPS33]